MPDMPFVQRAIGPLSRIFLVMKMHAPNITKIMTGKNHHHSALKHSPGA